MSHVLREPVLSGRPPLPDICSRCPADPKLAGHWLWNKTGKGKDGGKWRCRKYVNEEQKKYRDKRKADPDRYAAHQEYQKAHGISKSFHYRVGAYKSEDKRKGFAGPTITVEQATPLMEMPCTYCELPVSGGLDRVDNTKGHSIDNVVPCCVKCNGILIDLPFAAKKLLAAGLREARLAGHLDNWLPPQLRKNGIRS